MTISACYNPNPPVLLQQGFAPHPYDPTVGLVSNSAFRIRTDRGWLKHLDMIPFDNTIGSLNDNARITLNIGGQNLVENSQIGMWSVLSQFGKNHTWQIRGKFNQGQTGFTEINGTDPVLPASSPNPLQLIAKYSTDQHEQFLQDFRLRYGQGLKQRQYQSVIPVTAVAGTRTTLQQELPRNSGPIIGVGLSLVEDINDLATHPLFELSNTFITVNIDGVAIIENVSAIYYSWENGRDYYLQPVCINAGSTMELVVFQSGLNTTAFTMNINFYFGN